MPSPAIALAATLYPDGVANPDDIGHVRRALVATGDLDHDPGDVGGRFDRGTQAALRRFQRRHDLADDAIMLPGGESERTLDRALKRRPRLPELDAAADGDNRRFATALLRAPRFELPADYILDALGGGGGDRTRARAEVIDLVDKLRRAALDRADELARPVLAGLGHRPGAGEEPAVALLRRLNDDDAAGERRPADVAPAETQQLAQATSGAKTTGAATTGTSGGGSATKGAAKSPPIPANLRTSDDVFRFVDSVRPASEGGKSTRQAPADPGGNTNQGLSQKVWDLMHGRTANAGWPKDVLKLSPAQVTQVLRAEYFDRPRLHAFSQVPGLLKAAPKLVQQAYDASIHHAPADAIRWLQEALNEIGGYQLKTDGLLGQKTRDAVGNLVKRRLAVDVNNRIVEIRIAYMRTLSNYQHNKKGWIARAPRFWIGPRPTGPKYQP